MVNDYKFKTEGFTLTAEATDDTLKRLSATTHEFARQIIEREEQLILNNLPDEAILKLKRSIDSIVETRGLNE